MAEKTNKSSIIFRKLLIYLIIPVLISLIFIGGYFSGNLRLRDLIAPVMNREYGLLENFQNLILIVVIIMAVFGIVRKRLLFEKIILGFILAGALFLFLEEIDYGRLHYNYLIGNPLHDRGTNHDWNLHNLSNVNQFMKLGMDLGMIVFFFVFPLITWNSTNRRIRYLRPDPWFMLTLVAMFIISHIAHAIDGTGLGMDGALRSNTAEFREVLIYYILLIYVITFVSRRDYLLPARSDRP